VTLTPCPICRTPSDRRILALRQELDPAIAAFAERRAPTWTAADGICPACLQHFTELYAAQRSRTSLHTQTNPATTFPYYHLAEETILGQQRRLPSYTAFDGAGATIAFLDSGYYPHPDFARRDAWLGAAPAWQQLSEGQWRLMLENIEMRLIDYIDLTDDGERTGLGEPSLWDNAGDSWHGQMTMAIAAGNGLLSEGRFRGYAPGASLLPIKIGRGGGRIPEEDLLRGLEWLLRDDNWLRYGVRVLNISVGGDYPQMWEENAVCRAADALAQRGVLVAAAAGNRGVAELLAPAQTPSVLTVGGVDDHNRRWQQASAAASLAAEERLALYHHNYGEVSGPQGARRKPELLALARWLPSPILPPSAIFRETHTIGRLRYVLQGDDEQNAQRLLTHWQRALHKAGDGPLRLDEDEELMPEVWHALRRRMNAHKWVHPYYQHVDGTSVAVAQVSAVAAQMLAANPQLTGAEATRLLLATALPLPHLPAQQAGAGLLQGAPAVAAALRTAGGLLVGFPHSGTRLSEAELQNWVAQGTLPVFTLENWPQAAGAIYFGCHAPHANHVSLIGSFNAWLPGRLPLQPAANGWWHAAALLPPGRHTYRFWLETANDAGNHAAAAGFWRCDDENPARGESGYHDDHSVVTL
jgi:serine protease AprX